MINSLLTPGRCGAGREIGDLAEAAADGIDRKSKKPYGKRGNDDGDQRAGNAFADLRPKADDQQCRCAEAYCVEN